MNLSVSRAASLSHLILWLWVMIFVIPSCVSSVDELHRLCSTPFPCANQRDLSYPFWIKGREDCGHPEFEVDCGGEFAEISISSVKFRILRVEYTPFTLRLSRTDYVSTLCPLNPLNTTFNENFLGYTSDTELLTLYYECPNLASSLPSSNPYIGDFDCGGDDAGERSYYVTRNLTSPLLAGFRALFEDFVGLCKRNVKIPASVSALTTAETNPSQENLQRAFAEGFGVNVNETNCTLCIESNGACGYNQSSGRFVCYCSDGPSELLTCGGSERKRSSGLSRGAKLGIGLASGLVGCLLMAGSLFCFTYRRRNKPLAQYTSNQKLKALIPLKQYSYAELKRITKSFTNIVGRGGFGTVYGGNLPDGRKVAVKILKDSKGNGEEFVNEVASMSKTSHVNIVSLLGFCYEGSKRAIVYEFLENGSLDKLISGTPSSNTDWRTLYEIALGVARGLEYLHYGCKTRIVHFDIKPQNVLLDQNLCPKVSDFGLAKLCEKKESIMSLLDMRGTIGYIAPEVVSRMYGDVSHKSDVYSYGMLVLEMIGARNREKVKHSASNTSSMYFPDWVYKDLEKGESTRLLGDEITAEEDEMAKKMIMVGLWCIQSRPSDRPPMNKVVEMMEGSLDALEVPPKPVLHLPTAPLSDSPCPSEESLNSS